MMRLLGLTLATTVVFTVAAYAAPQKERVRGTIESFDNNSVTVKSQQGGDVKLTLDNATKYATVVKSSLSDVKQGSYIGVATKESGNSATAVEVVVFPASMRGAGEGHYPWDRLPDTSNSGGSVSSSMTNGTVAASSSAGSANQVSTAMTNGSVASSSGQSGGQQITVSYKGGEQKILIPPTTPVVTFEPGEHAVLRDGSHVFVVATEDNGKTTANFVAVGKGDLVPPM